MMEVFFKAVLSFYIGLPITRSPLSPSLMMHNLFEFYLDLLKTQLDAIEISSNVTKFTGNIKSHTSRIGFKSQYMDQMHSAVNILDLNCTFSLGFNKGP